MNDLIEAVGGWWPVLAILVFVFGVGRLSRIVTYDLFPPAAWLRQQWSNWTTKHGHTDWMPLLFCPWCFTPWVMLVSIGWFMLGFVVVWLAWAWWIFWGWLALSYLASIVLAYDEPKSSDD
jgi:hypothetical protein